MSPFLTTLSVCLLLAACNTQQSATSDAATPEQSVTQTIHQPLEKAKGVEQLLLDKAEEGKQQADGL